MIAMPPRHYSQIDGNLWMGGTPAEAHDVDRSTAEHRGFRFIINVAPFWPYPTDAHQVVLAVVMYDHQQLPDIQVLAAIADYINAVRKIGPTLVHCQQGWNRSGLVTAYALIRGGMEPGDAIALLRERRCQDVLCNRNFADWLVGKPKGLWDTPS